MDWRRRRAWMAAKIAKKAMTAPTHWNKIHEATTTAADDPPSTAPFPIKVINLEGAVFIGSSSRKYMCEVNLPK